jgi:hypothetical protein
MTAMPCDPIGLRPAITWFETRDHCAEFADEKRQIFQRLGVS